MYKDLRIKYLNDPSLPVEIRIASLKTCDWFSVSAEKERENDAGDKSADVGKICHAGRLSAADSDLAVHLECDPEPEHRPGGHVHDRPGHQHTDLFLRVENQV